MDGITLTRREIAEALGEAALAKLLAARGSRPTLRNLGACGSSENGEARMTGLVDLTDCRSGRLLVSGRAQAAANPARFLSPCGLPMRLRHRGDLLVGYLRRGLSVSCGPVRSTPQRKCARVMRACVPLVRISPAWLATGRRACSW